MDRTSINSKEIQADIETVWNTFTERKHWNIGLHPMV